MATFDPTERELRRLEVAPTARQVRDDTLHRAFHLPGCIYAGEHVGHCHGAAADKSATVTDLDVAAARLEADVAAARYRSPVPPAIEGPRQASRRRYLQRAVVHAERAQGLISEERRHISDADSRRAGVHAQLARFWLARAQVED